MQKAIIISSFLFLFATSTWAQFQNKDAHIVIKAGTTLHTSGDFVNQNGGVVDYAGTIEVDGDFINLGNLSSNAGSALKFSGDADAALKSGSVLLHKLIINLAAGSKLSVLDETIVHNAIEFIVDDTYIDIGNHHLFMTGEADFIGEDADNFILTPSTGQLKKAGLGVNNFTFPIGFDKDAYNPIYIKQAGTSETIGVRCLENVKYSGLAGNVIDKKVVAVAWDISESTPGENNLTLKPYWNLGDETPQFDRTKTAISRWDGVNKWTMLWDDLAAANGLAPYNITNAGVQKVGVFAVGNEPLGHPLQLSLKILLEGPESGGIMNDYLRDLAQFPSTEPFSGLGFTHVKYGGNEATTPIVLQDFGDNSNIVDWILLELRDKNDNTQVVATKSLFVQKDGTVVDANGKAIFNLHALPSDDYYIAIRHRNHLGICTANTYPLSPGLTPLDFTDGSIALFGNNATTTINGKLAMIAGDANRNGEVKYNGISNDRNKILAAVGLLTPANAPKGYFSEDVNLDGFIEYTGINNDRDVILKTVNPLMPNNTVIEQLPE